jgi:histone H2A
VRRIHLSLYYIKKKLIFRLLSIQKKIGKRDIFIFLYNYKYKMPGFKKNSDTYETFIRKVLAREDPDVRISRKAIRVMDDLLSQILIDIKKRALELTHIDNLKIVKSRAIEYAVMLNLPEGIAWYCNIAQVLALTRFNGFTKREFEKVLEKHGFGAIANAAWVENSNDGTPVKKYRRAGIKFDVGRVHRHLKEHTDNHVSEGAAVGLAASLDMLTTIIFKTAVGQLRRTKTIKPRHIMLGISNNTELSELFKDYVIMNAGVPLSK